MDEGGFVFIHIRNAATRRDVREAGRLARQHAAVVGRKRKKLSLRVSSTKSQRPSWEADNAPHDTLTVYHKSDSFSQVPTTEVTDEEDFWQVAKQQQAVARTLNPMFGTGEVVDPAFGPLPHACEAVHYCKYPSIETSPNIAHSNKISPSWHHVL